MERLREPMPTISVRKLCQLAGINRQWYSQRRRPSERGRRDEQLRHALETLRETFAGYGYRRMTKALTRAGWKVNHKRV
ncbi:MAG TPA: IS3 family transposase [Ktedonobacteraceae bacterium]|nr:IS3 family transposase [Ktedonobacteraceae bacterium]